MGTIPDLRMAEGQYDVVIAVLSNHYSETKPVPVNSIYYQYNHVRGCEVDVAMTTFYFDVFAQTLQTEYEIEINGEQLLQTTLKTLLEPSVFIQTYPKPDCPAPYFGVQVASTYPMTMDFDFFIGPTAY